MSVERVNAGVGIARLILDIVIAVFDRAKANKTPNATSGSLTSNPRLRV